MELKSNRSLKRLWIAEVSVRMYFSTTISAYKLWVFKKFIDLRAWTFIF